MVNVWICLYFGSDSSEKSQPRMFKKIDAHCVPRAGEWLHIENDEFLVQSIHHDFLETGQRITLECHNPPLALLPDYKQEEGWLDEIPE